MENKVSSSNPNVKNVTVPTAKKLLNSQQPKIIPVKGAKIAGDKFTVSVKETKTTAEETAELESVNASAQTQKLPKKKAIASAKKQDATEVKPVKTAATKEESAKKKATEEKPRAKTVENPAEKRVGKANEKPAKKSGKKANVPSDEEGDVLIEKIREDAEEHAEEVKQLSEKDSEGEKKSDEKPRDSKDKEKIRIVIRDAKPPIMARILQGLMRVICLILIVAVCGIGIPRLFGINEFNVLTASMSPTYPTGSLVFVQPKEPATIRPGEVVTCIMNEDLDMVTHRVTKNDYDEKTLTTKGDANMAEDSPTLYENVVGVVVFSLPYIGAYIDYLTNDTNGRVLGIGGVLCILALTFIAEAICFLLTKQAASVYNNPGDEKSSSSAKKGKGKGKDKGKGKSKGKEEVNVSSDDGDEKYEITSINAREFNRKFRRGKGAPVETVAPREEREKHKRKHHHKLHQNEEEIAQVDDSSKTESAGEASAATKPVETEPVEESKSTEQNTPAENESAEVKPADEPQKKEP